MVNAISIGPTKPFLQSKTTIRHTAKWLFGGPLDGGFVDLGFHLVFDGLGLTKTSHRHTVKALQPRIGMFLPVSWRLTLLAILACPSSGFLRQTAA
ncbi:hypothetical protein [Mesorhizobium sp. M0478]|uniref:hypothetical protein n=1 Tax=Mesorhizobium sp. M0478 TaxID=2956947 RepID=UPI003336A833